jgi:hypothetical protein
MTDRHDSGCSLHRDGGIGPDGFKRSKRLNFRRDKFRLFHPLKKPRHFAAMRSMFCQNDVRALESGAAGW